MKKKLRLTVIFQIIIALDMAKKFITRLICYMQQLYLKNMQ